jgi:glycerophosphoryl diester phosphodiesterase
VTPITFAHRGARLAAPENTIDAFRAALAAGVRGIETDAWLGADGTVVLSHDATVGRGLRRRRVDRMDAAARGACGVPTLGELYGLLGTRFELSVDAKEARVARPVVDEARAHGAVERLWLCSPDLALLRSLRDVPGVHLVHSTRRSALDRVLERHAAALGAAGIDAMNLHHREWTAGLVSLFHRFDVRAFAWDVQEVRHALAVLRMGVDAVYGDHPDRLVATVAAFAEGRAPDA